MVTTFKDGVWRLTPSDAGAWSSTQIDKDSSGFEHAAYATDLRAFADFLSQHLLRLNGVRSVRSSIVLHRIKQTTELPLDHVGT